MMKSCILLLVVVTMVQTERLYYKPRMINVLPDWKYKLQQTMNLPAKKPAFCNKLDCPEYKVIEKKKDYELRKYAATSWVSTQLAGIDYKEASSEMFMKLFNYIQGKNVKKEKIAMTAPVLMRVIPGQGPACENNFTMSFFMSNKVTDPPKPTDPTVHLDHYPVTNVYVRQFGGYKREIKDWIEEAQKLVAAINDPSKYNSKYYYTAGYNSPFEIFHRHNEIWFIAK